MINRVWSALVLVVLLSGCGWDGTATRPNDITTLSSIQIVAVSPTIAAGTSTKLSVIGSFSGLYTRDVTDQAVFTSGDITVAEFKFTTAPNLNRVTGNAAGTAIITAKVGGVSATYPLVVSNAAIQTMTITPAAPPDLPKGRTTQFSVSGTFLDGTTTTTQDLTFDAAWSSGTIDVVTVSNDPASKGLARAVAAVGSSTISATFPPAGGAGSVSGTKLVTVIPPVLDSITVTPANSSIAGASKTVNFTATGNYSDGTTAAITNAAWVSSAPAIATVNATSGVATTVAAGTTIISATQNGVIGSTRLTVTSLVLNANGLQITPVNQVLAVNASLQMTVTATFNDGSTSNVATGSAWVSSSPAIASVSSTGLVTGVSAGTSTITAQYGGQTVFTTVIVQ
jgi:hypothetical protein